MSSPAPSGRRGQGRGPSGSGRGPRSEGRAQAQRRRHRLRRRTARLPRRNKADVESGGPERPTALDQLTSKTTEGCQVFPEGLTPRP